jgi:hypothetical protein
MSIMHEYLVVYDYGMGGAWAVILAAAASDIQDKFPELIVFYTRPEWMARGYFEDIRRKRMFSLDDESTYPKWIWTLISQRGAP